MGMLLVMALLAQTPERAPLSTKDRTTSSDDQRWAEEHDRAMATQTKAPDELLRTPPLGWAEGATQRLIGAFLGGAIGVALPSVVAGLATTPCVFGCSISFGSGLAASLAPALSVVGATVGFGLAGGRASVGAASAGLLGGMALSLVLLFFHRIAVPETSEVPWGVVIGAAAIAVALEAIALESRNDALDEAPFLEVPAARLAFSSLGLFATVAGVTVLATLVGVLGYPAGLIFGPLIGLVGAGVAPLVPWAVHRSMGGEGSLGAAYLGWLGSLAIAAGGVGVMVLAMNLSFLPGQTIADPRNVMMLGAGVGMAAIAAVLGTPLALEWSHGDRRIDRSKLAPSVKAQLSLSPIVGPRGVDGGALAMTGTF